MIVIKERNWSVTRERMANFGECDYDTKKITVHEDLRGHAEIETVVHEVLHAQHADWPEEDVLIRGQEIADALWEVLECRLTVTG